MVPSPLVLWSFGLLVLWSAGREVKGTCNEIKHSFLAFLFGIYIYNICVCVFALWGDCWFPLSPCCCRRPFHITFSRSRRRYLFFDPSPWRASLTLEGIPHPGGHGCFMDDDETRTSPKSVGCAPWNYVLLKGETQVFQLLGMHNSFIRKRFLLE